MPPPPSTHTPRGTEDLAEDPLETFPNFAKQRGPERAMDADGASLEL